MSYCSLTRIHQIVETEINQSLDHGQESGNDGEKQYIKKAQKKGDGGRTPLLQDYYRIVQETGTNFDRLC